jgi:hypothetical protein
MKDLPEVIINEILEYANTGTRLEYDSIHSFFAFRFQKNHDKFSNISKLYEGRTTTTNIDNQGGFQTQICYNIQSLAIPSIYQNKERILDTKQYMIIMIEEHNNTLKYGHHTSVVLQINNGILLLH